MLCLSGFELYSRWVPLSYILLYFHVKFLSYINLFNVCSFIYLGHFFYQSVQECPECICISESQFQWGRPRSNAQLHNRLG